MTFPNALIGRKFLVRALQVCTTRARAGVAAPPRGLPGGGLLALGVVLAMLLAAPAPARAMELCSAESRVKPSDERSSSCDASVRTHAGESSACSGVRSALPGISTHSEPPFEMLMVT